MTPEERRARGRIAANKRWAGVRDRRAATQAARDAQMAGWLQQAREMHPDADEDLIRKAAQNLQQAHISKMTLASLRSRSAKKAQAPDRGNQGPG